MHEPVQRSAGSHRIATHLRREGWNIEVIDFAAWWSVDELKELVKSRISSSTKFFGFSTFCNKWTDDLSAFTRWLKETYPNIPTILGGQSVALTPASNIDYWVDSFGEVAIVELLKYLTTNSTTSPVFDVEHFGSKKLIKSIHAYPAYPMQSYSNVMERRDFLQPYEWVNIELSRGCVFSCNFCNFPILGIKGDYSRTADDFDFEMRHNYDNFGIQNYYIADETFNDSPAKIRKFANVAEQLPFRPYFSGFLRADLLTAKPDTWDDLIRLGVGGHCYGIETFNHKSAKMISKGMHPDKLKQGLLDIKQYFGSRMFYRGSASFIIGLPYETPETFAETEKWLDANWQDQGLISFPLSIDDLSGAKRHNYTNVSKLSLTLVEHGIREMTTAEKTRWGDFDYIYNWRDGDYYKDLYMWEHDGMNIFQARKIADTLHRKQILKYKANCWQLSHLMFNAAEKIDLHTVAHLSNVQAHKNPQRVEAFLRQYIDSKLNWA